MRTRICLRRTAGKRQPKVLEVSADLGGRKQF